MPSDTDLEEAAAKAPRRIVVGFDGSANAMAAVEWAAAQAQRTDAVLKIVAAYGPGYVFVNPSEVRRVLGIHICEATRQAQKVAPAIVVDGVAHEGSPEAVLIKESASADLLVVGSRGLGGFKGLLLGSVSRNCLNRALCPVVVVNQKGHTTETQSGKHAEPSTTEFPKETSAMNTQPETERRIVVGIDGSPSSVAALEWAANQAELTGADLEVLMTWEWPYGYGWSPVPNDYDPAHDAETYLAGVVAPLREAHSDVSIQATVIEGHPAPLLVKASNGADLLVVGSRGHGEFTGMLLGSVSEHCVSNAHCPVLVVRDRK